jgi:hypothetical protein
MSTDEREQMSEETRASVERGLQQSAAGDFVAVDFLDGTTFALTGENAGHWVEGSPTHVKVADAIERGILYAKADAVQAGRIREQRTLIVELEAELERQRERKVAVVSYQERYEGGGTLGVFKDVETAQAWITKTHPGVVQEPGDNSTYTEGDTFYTIDLMEVRS